MERTVFGTIGPIVGVAMHSLPVICLSVAGESHHSSILLPASNITFGAASLVLRGQSELFNLTCSVNNQTDARVEAKHGTCMPTMPVTVPESSLTMALAFGSPGLCGLRNAQLSQHVWQLFWSTLTLICVILYPRY